MESASEYRLKVSVRNNLILKAIEDHGYKSLMFFAKVNDLSYPALINMVGLKLPPLMTNGEFCVLAKQLMEILGAAPNDLWTDEQLTMKLQKNSSERSVGKEDFERLFNRVAQGQIEYADPEDTVHQQELERILGEHLERLNPRYALLLRMRFGLGGLKEHSLEEIAIHFGVTRERIRQIEAKALRMLKHPDMSDPLRLLIDPEYKLRTERAKRKLMAERVKRFTEDAMEIEAATQAARAKVARKPEDTSWVDHLKRTAPELYEALKEHVQESTQRLADHADRLRTPVHDGRKGA